MSSSSALSFARVPFFVILIGVSALAMMVPAGYASVSNFDRIAQPFFYSAVLFGVLTLLLALATMNIPARSDARNQLVTLLAAFAVLPLMLAVPMSEALPERLFFEIYFEMVSSLTTTGASVFDNPEQLAAPLHLWRALVAWLGGLLMLVSAAAILAPLSLGGFEVLRSNDMDTSTGNGFERAPGFDQLSRFALIIFPVYLTATSLLWLGLTLTKVDAFVALCIALSALSTSGILPVSTTLDVGFLPEIMVLVFLFLATSRRTLIDEVNRAAASRLIEDREIRLAIIVVAILSVIVFFAHWLQPGRTGYFSVLDGLRALWGMFFTFLSFVTTTGFVSGDWVYARAWTSIHTPELILAALCMLGGGVATTAGGVKLLRVYALYRHGAREVGRLVHPNSIGRAGWLGRSVRRQGAFIAWIFFMLFALSTALVAVGLSFMGLNFHEAFIFAVAALSTTGPLAEITLDGARSYGDLNNGAKSILMIAMVLGRLETLAIIALFNPDFWRS